MLIADSCVNPVYMTVINSKLHMSIVNRPPMKLAACVGGQCVNGCVVCDRWFDKNMCQKVFPNAYYGTNVEHTHIDATVSSGQSGGGGGGSVKILHQTLCLNQAGGAIPPLIVILNH